MPTATAESRLSTLAINAMVTAASTTSVQPSPGNCGAKRICSRSPGSSTRGNVMPATSEITVATAIAASGPGTLRTAADRPGQTTRITMMSSPITAAASWWATTCAGSSTMFSRAELCACPPSTTWSWPSTIVTPMPASIPCTMAGEIASAARAMRLRPNSTCSAPASTVIRHATAHPKVAIVGVRPSRTAARWLDRSACPAESRSSRPVTNRHRGGRHPAHQRWPGQRPTGRDWAARRPAGQTARPGRHRCRARSAPGQAGSHRAGRRRISALSSRPGRSRGGRRPARTPGRRRRRSTYR